MTTTWNAKPDDMRRMFASVLPHTGKDDTLPLLTCVQLEVDQESISAAATDRFSMAASRFQLSRWAEQGDDTRDPASVQLFAADVRRLFTFVAPFKNMDARWELTAERLTVTSAGGVAGIATRDYGDFPNWRNLMRKVSPVNEALPGVRLFPCTPAFLARFSDSAKALGESYGRISMFFPPNRRQPVTIRIGDGFAGMLMPHNVDDSEQVLNMDAALGAEVTK